MTINKTHLGLFFTFLLIVLSGSVVLSWNRFYLLAALAISMVIFLSKTQKIDKELLYIIGALTIVVFFQYLQFSFFSFWTTSGTFIRFLVPFFFIKIIGVRFPLYYVKIIYVFTIISWLFYFPSLIIPGFHEAIGNIPSIIGTEAYGQGTNFFIYTVEPSQRYGIFRNSGPFGEPGMFSVYLTLALVFNTIRERKLFETKNLVFMATILTTFSTAGYIVLFLFIALYYLSKGSYKYYLFVLPIVLSAAWYAYFNLEFMGDKIQQELMAIEADAVYAGRLGSAVRDFQDIKEYPLFGRGRNVETRFDDYAVFDRQSELLFHRTNGVTAFIVQYGLLFALLYYVLIRKSLYRFCQSTGFNTTFASFALIAILTVGMSQTVFQHVVFIALMYYFILFNSNSTNDIDQLV